MSKIIFTISSIEFFVFSIGAFVFIEDLLVSFIFESIGAAAVPLLELKFQKDYKEPGTQTGKEDTNVYNH